MHPDVLIIGGGAVGLSLAWHLSLAKARVLVMDPKGPGLEASSVAAGVLSRLHEFGSKDPTLAPGLESLAMFPGFVRRIQAEGGRDARYRRTGFLLLKTAPPAGWASGVAAAAQAHGIRAAAVGEREIRRIEPGLAPRFSAGVFGPDEATLPAAAYSAALAAACRRRGVRFLARAAASFRIEGGRLISLRAGRELSAGAYALCAGAWAGRVGRALGLRVPVAPTRGQLLRLSCRPDAVRHVVECDEDYLVPRMPAERAVTVGTTLERVGFRRGTTASAMADLKAFAGRLYPALRAAPELGRVSGFRPECADGLPLLGRAAGLANLWLACGHFRQGLILSPWTGKLMAGAILSDRETPAMTPFSPARFAN